MKSKKDKKEKKLRLVLLIAALTIILILFQVNELTEAASTVPQEISVTIPAGSSNQQIAELLADSGVIKSKYAFLFLSKYLGYDKSLKAGSYVLDSSWNLNKIINELSKGQVQSIKFTIPEGYHIEQIAEKLAAEGLVDREKFLTLANSDIFDYPFLKDIDTEGYLLEGYLFPDTYQVTKGMDELDIIKMMLNRFNQIYDENLRERAKELNLTDHEVITIASMVEKEAKFDEDRPLIASVIYNRLKIGMPLQIDATVQFALGTTKPKLYKKDLKVDSPYNTYLNYGLPPGPIGSPGKASILAALYPKETDYLYYLAKSDGTHVFSKTLEEHNAAKQKYIK